MIRSLLAASLLFLAALAHAESAVYRAVLASRIQALLTVDTAPGEVRGTARYDAGGAEGLRLEGHNGAEGMFEWREISGSRDGSAQTLTGMFAGRLADDGRTGAGEWRKADDSGRLPLVLERVARIARAETADAGAFAEYPRFDAARFARLNAQLEAQARQESSRLAAAVQAMRAEMADVSADTRAGLAQQRYVEVASVCPASVSLLYTFYEFGGGAHGNSSFTAANYVIGADGAVLSFGLWDVLVRSPDTLRRLSALLLAELRRQRALAVVEGQVRDLVQPLGDGAVAVTVVPAGLAFHFPPYAVGPYAQGAFRAVLPARALMPFNRPDAPVALPCRAS